MSWSVTAASRFVPQPVQLNELKVRARLAGAGRGRRRDGAGGGRGAVITLAYLF